MVTAFCSKCGVAKGADAFHKDASRASGLRSQCKVCVMAWRKQNSARLVAYYKEWRARNPAAARAQRARYYYAHREARVENVLKWQRENRGAAAAKSRARSAAKLKATPAWADLELIELVYVETAALNRDGRRGVLHVDHIVPLRSNRVCGLHVAHNLQLLSPSENSSKSNRYWPDMA
jgi:hypothetical protein